MGLAARNQFEETGGSILSRSFVCNHAGRAWGRFGPDNPWHHRFGPQRISLSGKMPRPFFFEISRDKLPRCV